MVGSRFKVQGSRFTIVIPADAGIQYSGSSLTPNKLMAVSSAK
ncbi:MAG: hypothetical protein DDT32_00414 [Syntrophomonadaceae bacterium]|nr:hypothetical protein [Bacillota bacterium]